MVAMLLLHIVVALQARLACSFQWLLPSSSSTGLVGMVAALGSVAQRRCSSRLLSSGGSPLQHALRGGRSLIIRGASSTSNWFKTVTFG